MRISHLNRTGNKADDTRLGYKNHHSLNEGRSRDVTALVAKYATTGVHAE